MILWYFYKVPPPRCCALRRLLWCLSLSVRWWPPGLSSRWEYYLCLFHSTHAQQLSTGDKGLVEKIPVGFIVNKTSHQAHVWNTKRCVAFAACRWWSATVCINKRCGSVSVCEFDANTNNMEIKKWTRVHIEHCVYIKGFMFKTNDLGGIL